MWHRFSGISEADMRTAVMTLSDVHTLLKRLFNSKTILIGHSLESDLIALKVSALATVTSVFEFVSS